MRWLFVAALCAGLAALPAAEKVTGLWKVIDDQTKRPKAVVCLYLHEGKLFGRILVAISTDTGRIVDDYLTRSHRLDKLKGEPPVCGLDFIYGMVERQDAWLGTILDPEPASEYECVIKVDRTGLTVRGQLKGLGFLGRDQHWVPATDADLPPGFVVPDPASFVPVVPVRK